MRRMMMMTITINLLNEDVTCACQQGIIRCLVEIIISFTTGHVLTEYNLQIQAFLPLILTAWSCAINKTPHVYRTSRPLQPLPNLGLNECIILYGVYNYV